jgi:hypothetical protein
MADESAGNVEDGTSQIQDFIFLRELSEVYLLIDHVSGRSDKSLESVGASGAAQAPLQLGWLEQICEIGWPPKGSDVQKAGQAATLLRAKDRLNFAAKPASGATIAFTLLVSGEDNSDQPSRSSIRDRFLRRLRHPKRDGHDVVPPSAAGGGRAGAPNGGGKLDFSTGGWGGNAPSRLSLARLAYPGLVTVADRFTWQIRGIILLLLLWLIVTCSLSWDVAFGHAIFHRLDGLRAQSATLTTDIAAAEADMAKQAADPATKVDHAVQALGMTLLSCDWPLLLRPQWPNDLSEAGKLSQVSQVELCSRIARQRRDYAVSRANLADWMAPWGWLKGVSHFICGSPCLTVSNGSVTLPEDAPIEQWAAILLEVLASAVLPLCYGLLGAGAAVVRSLWGKMRDSLLSPRDLTLALGQLALGAVIGASIGLFITPSSAPPDGSNGFTSSVALTGSALSFISGFGVEGVFVALESLIKRIFNLPEPAKSN